MAANAVDERFSFQQGLGRTFRLALNTSAQELDGLPPGKYFLRLVGIGANTCWLRATPAGSADDATVPAAVVLGTPDSVPVFPMDSDNAELTLHVRKGKTDRVSAILTAGTATMMITRIGE